MTSKPNVQRAVDAGDQVVGSVKGWSSAAVAYASRWPGEKLERSEYVVGTSHGGAVYARAFTAPLMEFPKMRIAVVENLSRKADDRQARDLLLQELEGPVEGSVGRDQGGVGGGDRVLPGDGDFGSTRSRSMWNGPWTDAFFCSARISPSMAERCTGPTSRKTPSRRRSARARGTLPRPGAISTEGPPRRLRYGGLSGVSLVELGGAEAAGEIPRAAPLGGTPLSRERVVGTVRCREIGPGVGHPADPGAERPRHGPRSDLLPTCCLSPWERRSDVPCVEPSEPGQPSKRTGGGRRPCCQRHRLR